MSFKSTWAETKLDFKLSFHYFRDNIKAFFWASLIALGISLLISYGMHLLFTRNPPPQPRTPETNSLDYLNFIKGVLFTFIWCQYGLAYDIMSSGDMCTEVQKMFVYFKKHGLSYLTASIFFTLPTLILSYHSDSEWRIPFSWIPYVMVGLQLLSTILFIGIFPGITAEGSFLKGAKSNFKILHKHFPRILLTWIIYFAVYTLPLSIFNIGTFRTPRLFIWGDSPFSFITQNSIVAFIYNFVDFSLRALISTRIYNSITIPKNETIMIDEVK